MSFKGELAENKQILYRLLDNLLATSTAQKGRTGSDLRRQIGRVRGEYRELLLNGGFSLALLTCFRLAEEANVSLPNLAYVRQKLFEEEPIGDMAMAIVQSAIIFCLAAESRIITKMQFVSRSDVEAMMATMKTAFDTARDLAADDIDSSSYQQLTFLAGVLTNHLATTSRPLPRMISFHMPKNYPALKLSHRIYYVADRAEQLVAENHTVHPAFMQRELRGLNR